MIYIATDKENRDALMHYGVPGMRWRNRRGPQPLAPGTPGLSLPQRTHMINNRSVGSVGHKTTFKSHHASIRPSDTRDLPLSIPTRSGSPTPSNRNSSSIRSTNRPDVISKRQQPTRASFQSGFYNNSRNLRTNGNGLQSTSAYMRRLGNGLSRSDTHADEGLSNRPVGPGKSVSSANERDLRRRRYGR